jgi:hypothetical protein
MTISIRSSCSVSRAPHPQQQTSRPSRSRGVEAHPDDPSRCADAGVHGTTRACVRVRSVHVVLLTVLLCRDADRDGQGECARPITAHAIIQRHAHRRSCSPSLALALRRAQTVSLLSLILSWQYAHPAAAKLVYCTRTVQEMDKVVEELRRVVAYRVKVLGAAIAEQVAAGNLAHGIRPPEILGVCLSSRRNLCIHPVVSKHDNRGKVDALCRNKTASFVREQKAAGADVEVCSFYEGYEKEGKGQNSGVGMDRKCTSRAGHLGRSCQLLALTSISLSFCCCMCFRGERVGYLRHC